MSDRNGLPTGKHTLVEEGTEFKGTMSSSCPIVVMGKVEGDVAGPVIHVSQTGSIAGHVKVKELRSEGEVAGEVEAEVVQISGRVRDRTVIRARSLEVALSSSKGMQVVFGECELAVGDAPDKESAIAAALAPMAAQPAPAAQPAAEPAQPAAAPAAAPPSSPAAGPAPSAAEPPQPAQAAEPPASAAESAAQAASPPPAETREGKKSRRGTQPPPV